MTRRHRSRQATFLLRATAVVALGAVTIGSLPAAGAAPAPRNAPLTVLAPSTTRTIDRTDKAAVKAAYLERLVPAINTPVRWTGSTNGCIAGTESAASRRATIRAVNFYRELVGIGPVAHDTAWSAKALQAALMMDAADQLSHDPGPTWPCYSASGDEAAGRSNLFWSTARSGAWSVSEYIVDEGSNNAAVGHRRWLLNSEISRIGTGSTAQANALWVVPEPGDSGTTGPDFVAWPPSGYVPLPLVVGPDAAGSQETLGRWSLSTRSDVDADFSAASVKVTTGKGTPLEVTVETRSPNSYKFGAAIVFSFTKPSGRFGLTRNATIKVVVAGIRLGSKSITKAYTVRLFPLSPPEIPVTTLSSPSAGRLRVSWKAAVPRGTPVTKYVVKVYQGNPYTTPPIATRSVSAATRSAEFDVDGGGQYFAFVYARSAAGTSAMPTQAYSTYVP